VNHTTFQIIKPNNSQGIPFRKLRLQFKNGRSHTQAPLEEGTQHPIIVTSTVKHCDKTSLSRAARAHSHGTFWRS
jgi:hypothetical protein